MRANILSMMMFLLLGSTLAISQDYSEALLKDITEYNNAFMKGDFEKVAMMTIPSVVEIGGGKKFMIDNIKASYELNQSVGLKFESISPTAPTEYDTTGDEIHAIVPQKVINKLGEAKFGRTMYYLASSSDDGMSWTFLDLEPYSEGSIKSFVPSFTNKLEIPEFAQPEIIEE